MRVNVRILCRIFTEIDPIHRDLLCENTSLQYGSMNQNRHKTSDGAEVAYRITGADKNSKVPLVLIMGLSGVMEDWSPFFEELGKSRRVLIFDHRGIGSSKLPEDWDFSLSHDIMADDLISLLISLGSSWSTVDVLGWSMGGHILQRMLTREGSQVDSSGKLTVGDGKISIRKIILAATLTKLPKGDMDMNKMQAEAEAIQDREARKLWMTEQMLRLQYDEHSLSDRSSPLQPILKNRIEVSLKTNRPQSIIAQQFLAISSLTLSQEDLSKIPASVPTLIIHGQRDRMVHPYMGARLQEWIKHAHLVDLSDGPEGAKDHQYGHFWFDYYGADYWAGKVDRFLDGNERSAKL
ncbi:unnamed protein product [Sympodiomycopsis kandeliae]